MGFRNVLQEEFNCGSHIHAITSCDDQIVFYSQLEFSFQVRIYKLKKSHKLISELVLDREFDRSADHSADFIALSSGIPEDNLFKIFALHSPNYEYSEILYIVMNTLAHGWILKAYRLDTGEILANTGGNFNGAPSIDTTWFTMKGEIFDCLLSVYLLHPTPRGKRSHALLANSEYPLLPGRSCAVFNLGKNVLLRDYPVTIGEVDEERFYVCYPGKRKWTRTELKFNFPSGQPKWRLLNAFPWNKLIVTVMTTSTSQIAEKVFIWDSNFQFIRELNLGDGEFFAWNKCIAKFNHEKDKLTLYDSFGTKLFESAVKVDHYHLWNGLLVTSFKNTIQIYKRKLLCFDY